MAAKKVIKASKDKPASRKPGGFSDQERAAIREHREELRAEAAGGRSRDKLDGEALVLAKLAELPPKDRELGERLHALVKLHAPALEPKTWYGMPAYARDGNVVCFFQSGQKFKTRYATLGFSDKAQLDDGSLWPTAFAITELSPVVEARIAALLKKATG